MHKQLEEKFPAKKGKYTHVIVGKDGDERISTKLFLEDPEELWDEIEEKEYEAVAEVMPHSHPLIFSVKGPLDESQILDLVRTVQGELLNLERDRKLKKEELSCYVININMGAKKETVNLKFDFIHMNNKLQFEEIFPAIRDAVEGFEFMPEIYNEKFWFVRPADSAIFFAKFIEDEEDETFEDVTSFRQLKIREEDCDEKEIIDSKVIDNIIENSTSKPETFKEYTYKDYIKLIKKDRFKYKTEWEDVGATIFNITEGSEDGMKTWQVLTGYDEKECENKWNEFFGKDIHYTINTLKYMASVDSPIEFNEYNIKLINNNRDICLSDTSYYTDYAKFIIPLVNLKFLCYVEGNKRNIKWMHFMNHRYVGLEDDIAEFDIRDFISETIAPIFVGVHGKILKEMGSIKKIDPKSDKLGELKVKLKACKDLIKYLKSSAGKNNILNEMIEKRIIRDDKFHRKKNSNRYKRHFNNGIYNYKYGELVPGKPEDFITLTVGRPYRISLTSEVKAMQYLEKVFTDEKVRDAFLLLISISIIFGNDHKIVVVCIGDEGNNSKTTIIKIINKAFGDYALDVGSGLITSTDVKLGGHCAELAELENIPIALHGETSVGKKVNSSLLKTISSGGDIIKVREPYGKKMKTITAGSVLWLGSNFVLEFSDIREHVASQRLVYLPFTSRFSKDAPKNEEDQKKQRHFSVVTNFELEISKMIDGFTTLISKRYIKYLEDGCKLDLPDVVLQKTVEYREKVDVMVQYMNSHIRKEDGSSFTLKEIYPHFKNWYETGSRPLKLRPTDEAVRDWLNKRLGHCGTEEGRPTDEWKGFKLLP